jgi:hypothetical protein
MRHSRPPIDLRHQLISRAILRELTRIKPLLLPLTTAHDTSSETRKSGRSKSGAIAFYTIEKESFNNQLWQH